MRGHGTPAAPATPSIRTRRLGPAGAVASLPVLAVLVAIVAAASGTALVPALRALPALQAIPIVPSTYGSGAFGRWLIDADGLPAYSFTAGDAALGPLTTQPGGASGIVHQVGNDHVVAMASNEGYTELWSQDRLYQWVNRYDAAGGHYAGGYGYLRTGRRVVTDLYGDRPPGSAERRIFGVGYFEKDLDAGGIAIGERTYAPFGDDPVLLDDVTLTNTTGAAESATWYEYWDVNPYDQYAHVQRGLSSPVWDPARRLLSVAQAHEGGDADPLSVYAAVLAGPVDGFDTSSTAFFGSGGPGRPAAVAADRASGSIAPAFGNGAVGRTMFAFRSPVRIAARSSVTLRYAYGAADPGAIDRIVDRWAARPGAFGASARAWSAWLPRVTVGTEHPWLGRELAWDAYMLRSGATYEQCAGEHIISQGGYYQYLAGQQIAYRDPLQFALALVFSDPQLAGEIILYSAREQTSGGAIPYGTGPLCSALTPGTSDDMDLWLLLAASEYGLATRDFAFFDQPVPYRDGPAAPLWRHLELAFRHQESLVGPHGDYLALSLGDWLDGAVPILHMTESSLVTAQAAAIYPIVADLARAGGDTGFATALGSAARHASRTLASDWMSRGWYARGWAGAGRIGAGAIFEEPQGWALVAGTPSERQTAALIAGTPSERQTAALVAGTPSERRAAALIANVRRYLTGIGAPHALHGPSRIGSTQSPAAADPGVTERTLPPVGAGDGNAVYVGGTWFALNGVLVWGLAGLDPAPVGADEFAFDEYLRNTLAAHATAFPDAWDGTISVDDTCWSWYSSDPGRCGIVSGYEGQIMHQPAWALFDTLALTDIRATAAGYDIDPKWPATTFDVQYPDVGLARSAHSLAGYFVVASSGRPLELKVTLPDGVGGAPVHAEVGGRGRVAIVRQGNRVSFSVRPGPGGRVDWALTW